ncbi:MAG: hypothetical protein JXK04_04830 [Campylobacterales bacterium]|nr:hypothetical protein [Campylobacterales bacterium]
MKDNEPTLNSIEDYNTLKGEKKRIVWTVIIAGLLIGALIVGARYYYGDANDSIQVEDSIGKVPLK